MLKRTVRICSAVPLVVACLLSGSLAALADKTIQYQQFVGPSERFTLEYPKKDWRIIPGGGAVLVTIAEKNSDAVVIVERARLNLELAREEITDVFAQNEADVARERRPGATGVNARVIDNGTLRFILLQYTQPGTKGAERVREYSFPIGTDLYRLICTAPADQFDKFEPIFGHIATTFRARRTP